MTAVEEAAEMRRRFDNQTARLLRVEAERDQAHARADSLLLAAKGTEADLLDLAREMREMTASVEELRSKLDATRSVLGYREAELLALKGPCSTCRLHYAHSGPCDTRPAEAARGGNDTAAVA